ncbi:hypothetical protein [Zoogloea sp.]|uniref:hypothetical protein n=1 Tax=Zoogloea sp. TaxID=49181 RepID=UPI0035AF6EB8
MAKSITLVTEMPGGWFGCRLDRIPNESLSSPTAIRTVDSWRGSGMALRCRLFAF